MANTGKGYTLNLFPINDKILLNGKEIGLFVDSHLPEIHRIMILSLEKENLSSVSEYNHILDVHLRKALDKRQAKEAVVGLNNSLDTSELLATLDSQTQAEHAMNNIRNRDASSPSEISETAAESTDTCPG